MSIAGASSENASHGFRFLEGLSEVAGNYDAFILDIYGVIHNGLELFPGTVDAMTRLRALNKRAVLVSNTPARSHDYGGKLVAMGLPETLYDGIVTAGDSAARALEEFEGRKCWFAGNDFRNLLDGRTFELVDGPDRADFILNAISGREIQRPEEICAALDRGIARGLPMVCANADLVVNIGDQQNKCAGTYALYYEENGGRVSWHGKPHAPVYETARVLLGRPDKSRMLAVGDSLRTDIQGANRFGIDSVFNLTGIHWEEVQTDHAPDKTDMARISKVIDEQPFKPDYVLGGFAW